MHSSFHLFLSYSYRHDHIYMNMHYCTQIYAHSDRRTYSVTVYPYIKIDTQSRFVKLSNFGFKIIGGSVNGSNGLQAAVKEFPLIDFSMSIRIMVLKSEMKIFHNFFINTRDLNFGGLMLILTPDMSFSDDCRFHLLNNQ